VQWCRGEADGRMLIPIAGAEKGDSPLHRLDDRAKLVALTGFVVAAMLTPTRPVWPWLALFGLLLVALAAGRVKPGLMAKRFLGLSLVVGVPFALSRLGGEATRLAGESFAVKSLLVAGGFFALTATAHMPDLLEGTSRVPGLSGMSALAAFILRGANMLTGEVVRTNRAWALRAPRARLGVRLRGLVAASISLLGRAAARSDRVGAAMVLRGFDGRMPPAPARALSAGDLAVGLLFAAISLAIGGLGRWA